MKIKHYDELKDLKILTSSIVSIVKASQENIYSILEFNDVGLFLACLETHKILNAKKTLEESKIFFNKDDITIKEILDITQASRILYLSEFLCALSCILDSELLDTVYDELILRGAINGFSLDAEIWELNIDVISEDDWQIISNWKPDERFK